VAGVKVMINDRALRRAIRSAHRASIAMRPAWLEVTEILMNSIRKNFDDQGRPKKWEPLKAPRRRGGTQVLIDTTRLMNSMQPVAMNSYAEVGTNVEYAATHHFGRGPIPARPFLLVQDEDLDDINHAIETHLLGDLI